MQTGSPILVLTDTGYSRSLRTFASLRTIEMKLPGGGTAILPVSYLYNIFGPNAPFIGTGRRLDVELVRLGGTNYYEPLNIVVNGQSFRNRNSIKEFTGEEVLSFTNISVTATSNTRSEPSLETTRAEFIFSALKSCLLSDESIESCLSELCEEQVEHEGFDYQFIYTKERIDGTMYYFVTAQRIVVTGFERTYLRHVFIFIYGITGLILLFAAFLLSRSVSRPLKALNDTAQRIAAMDFSHSLPTKRKDEFGLLAVNINSITDNLQSAMTTLTEANDKLALASRDARENEARMKKLLSDLAHEFKTPLGIISSYMEAIELGLAKDKEQYFRIIDGEIVDLTFMVNKAIELARLQSGSWKIELSNHNLCDILEGVRQKFTDRLNAQQYTFDVEDYDLVVSCDAHRIDQVICNFISNAIKYSDPRHEIRIYVTSDEKTAMIHVENSGKLPEGDIARLWQRDTGEATFSHTLLPSQGIGLDIVKSILDAHKSRYSAAEANGFVTFSFSLEIVQ